MPKKEKEPRSKELLFDLAIYSIGRESLSMVSSNHKSGSDKMD